MEIEREIYRERTRKRGEERTRWRVRERSPQFGGEASTGHPIGEALG